MIFEYIKNFSAANMLLLVIFCIISVTLLFFFMTFFKMRNRIKEIKIKEEFQEKIDAFLFNLMFSDDSIQEAIDSWKQMKKKNSLLFHQHTIKTIINLHHNYSGIYSKKLEHFFLNSGLANYSLAKLNSENWSHIVEGIRDLSSLNYLPAYPRIVSYKNHENKFVKTEVLLGMIKLKGISELHKFKNSKVYFNDWVQSNILYVVKNHSIAAPENFLDLLDSKNNSILLLTVRLVKYYSLTDHYEKLSIIKAKTEDPFLQKEITLLLKDNKQLQ